MSELSEYITRPGDTFEKIARKTKGTEQDAGLIASANPGVFEPLTEGLNIFSVQSDGPVSVAPSDDPDETVLTISGKRFRHWTNIIISNLLDGISSIQVDGPFEPSDPSHREVFKPFKYRDVQVHVGGKLLFRGTVIQTIPRISPAGRIISIIAYAKPGVLQDCTAPASAYPLEFDESTLKDIADKIVAPFGIKVVFESDPGAVFERVALSPGQPIFPFLVNLAQQRNLIISNDESGSLVFKQSAPEGIPVAVISDDTTPTIEVIPGFQQQRYYSHITGIEPVVIGLDGGQVTKRNDKLTGILRPHTFITTDTDGGDVGNAVDAKASRMFGDMVTYGVRVDTWRDARGNLWEPNTTIAVKSPGAMIYEQYNFLIRAVSFTRGPENFEAVLTLILPGSYEGKIPSGLPWD